MSERRKAAQAGKPLADQRRRAAPPPPETPTNRIANLDARLLMPLVLDAIDLSGGVCSQRQIVTFARAHLPPKVAAGVVQDRIGCALGLLFAGREIATRGEAETRVYFRAPLMKKF